MEKVRIYVWSDGTWCMVEDIEDYNYMSDDYISMRVNIDSIEEAVDAYVRS